MAPQRFHEQFDQIQRSMPDVPLATGPDDSAEFMYEKGVVLVRDGEEARIVEDTVRAHFTAAPDLDQGQVRRAGPQANRSGVTRIRVGDPGEGSRGTDRAVRRRCGPYTSARPAPDTGWSPATTWCTSRSTPAPATSPYPSR
ncbi:hypothetical protein SAFG77S_00173 [Streptomyces afghaniensis]